MALVISQADAKHVIVADRSKSIGDRFAYFRFDDVNMPYASSVGHVGDRVGRPHFHARDQFQVSVDGNFRLGRHPVSPYSIHFARAYTPYGPLVPEGDYTFMVLRARRDAGAQYLPEKAEELKAIPNRRPWQVTARAPFPGKSERDASRDAIFTIVPEIKDGSGLAAYTLVLKPNVKVHAPSPSGGDGQYLLVVTGSLLHENVQHKALALVFVKPNESAYLMHAGSDGLEAIVLNFPSVGVPMVGSEKPAASSDLRAWQCKLCAFFYDEEKGMPEEGIAPGTRWADIPHDWTCPDCNASKNQFEITEF